jgi:hypothetical protein
MTELFVAIRAALVTIVAWMGANLITGGIRVAVATAVIFAWAVFLGLVMTGLGGMGVFTILSTNPLTGLPHDMFVLFCLVFPFGFFVRLVIAYIVWCLTMQQAAIVMTKVVRVLFGG